jgi:hypothetical protein
MSFPIRLAVDNTRTPDLLVRRWNEARARANARLLEFTDACEAARLASEALLEALEELEALEAEADAAGLAGELSA